MSDIIAGRDDRGRVFVNGVSGRVSTFVGGPHGSGIYINDPETARAIALAVLRAELPEAWADLVEALTIMGRHAPADSIAPTHCEHDELTVMADPADFTPEEMLRLDVLYFHPADQGPVFCSSYFGSA